MPGRQECLPHFAKAAASSARGRHYRPLLSALHDGAAPVRRAGVVWVSLALGETFIPSPTAELSAEVLAVGLGDRRGRVPARRATVAGHLCPAGKLGPIRPAARLA